MRPVRVIIADDNALFRMGLSRLLKDDNRLEVVADASDGQDAVEKAAALSPDVILMDGRMPNMDGIEAMQRITSEQPNVKVLFLSSFENEGDVLQAMRRGAGGYLLKDALPEAIITSIIAVDSGGRVLSDVVARRVVEIASGVRTVDQATDGMTAREIEVLKLMSSGLANKQIAYRLRISEKTVRNHLTSVYAKLGVETRAQAIVLVHRAKAGQPS